MSNSCVAIQILPLSSFETTIEGEYEEIMAILTEGQVLTIDEKTAKYRK